MHVQEIHFSDGTLPSKDLIKKWLNKVDEFFADCNKPDDVEKTTQLTTQAGRHKSEIFSNGSPKSGTRRNDSVLSQSSRKAEKRIGVHCVAGLGRAPFLVAIALVNNGCTPSNAIELIRKNRPGALNLAQANYILEFKGKSRKGKGNGHDKGKCNIF